MTHIRKFYAIMLVAISVSVMTNAANAASSTETNKSATTKKVKAKTSVRNSSSLAGQTDIVAKVDLPMVTNIMPWQEKEGSIPKNVLDFSALKDSMTPTDRDRLAGEIRYTSILNQPVDQK
jgi:hypothetical protein